MVPKSKRNRRAISSRPPTSTTVNVVKVENKPAEAVAPKSGTVEAFVTTANFVRDLKWTGIVTLIIALLILLAFFVIPR